MSKETGFTLIEVLVALVTMSIVTAGVLNFVAAHQHVSRQENLTMIMEANLRVGMERIVDSLRNAGYGVPEANLAGWIPWVSGLTANPTLVEGEDTAPDSLRVAGCTARPVATLAADSAKSLTNLVLNSTGLLDTRQKRLITIGDSDYAQVQWISDSGPPTITIDTNPAQTDRQGLNRGYPAGTPICRVDVLTFAIDTARHRLDLDRNDGNGPQPLVEGITDLQVETLVSGKQYRITLAARSEQPNSDMQSPPTRRLSTVVTLRNE